MYYGNIRYICVYYFNMSFTSKIILIIIIKKCTFNIGLYDINNMTLH